MAPAAGDYRFLTEGVHSKEALDLVKEHLMAVMGPASNAFGSTKIKAGKLQAAQIYAASVMFGYFIRRVDKRFQLDKALGTLGDAGLEDAAKRLERLFRSSGDSGDPDAAPEIYDVDETEEEQRERAQKTLKEYIASFDQQTLQETARMVSLEGAALVERQTTGLFGKIADLQK